MTAEEITAKGKGDKEMEMALLELEIAEGTKEMEIYIRLSSLYRSIGQPMKAADVLAVAVKMLRQEI